MVEEITCFPSLILLAIGIEEECKRSCDEVHIHQTTDWAHKNENRSTTIWKTFIAGFHSAHDTNDETKNEKLNYNL